MSQKFLHRIVPGLAQRSILGQTLKIRNLGIGERMRFFLFLSLVLLPYNSWAEVRKFKRPADSCPGDLKIVLAPIPPAKKNVSKDFDFSVHVDRVIRRFEEKKLKTTDGEAVAFKVFYEFVEELKDSGVAVTPIRNLDELWEFWKGYAPASVAFLESNGNKEKYLQPYKELLPMIFLGKSVSDEFYKKLLRWQSPGVQRDLTGVRIPFFWSPVANQHSGATFQYDAQLRDFSFICIGNDAMSFLKPTVLEHHEFNHLRVYLSETTGTLSPFQINYESGNLLDSGAETSEKTHTRLAKLKNQFGDSPLAFKKLYHELELYFNNQSFDEIFTYSNDFLRALRDRVKNPLVSEDSERAFHELTKSLLLNYRAQKEIENALSHLRQAIALDDSPRIQGSWPNFEKLELKLRSGTQESEIHFSLRPIVRDGKMDPMFLNIELEFLGIENFKLSFTAPSIFSRDSDPQTFALETLEWAEQFLYRSNRALKGLSDFYMELNLMNIPYAWATPYLPESKSFLLNVQKKLTAELNKILFSF